MATWTNYYKDNDRDGGYLEYLFNKNQRDLADLCMGHVDDPSAFALTISTSGGANMILVPTTSEKESTCISPFVHPKVHVITCSSSTRLLIHASTEEFTWFSYVRTRLVPRSYVRFPRPQKASPNAHLFHPH